MPIIFNELITIFALVLANGFFAGAEIAIVALRKTRIQELAEEGRSSARAVLALRDDPERFLATVQVGITVVSATAAAFSGESIAKRLAARLQEVPFIGEHAHGVSLALVIAAISYLSIVVGELVPKSLALRGAEKFALLVGRPILALSVLARPLVWLLGSSANLLLRPFGDRTTFTETRHSAEELQELVEEAAKAGVIHPEAGEIASRALELPELTAADVMVPRQDVVAIAKNASRDELQRILLEQTHTRIPVYEERIDNVTGYISIKDMLAMAWDQKLIVLADILRTPYFVPESKQVVELLKEMRSRHMPFAIVVDEQGGMSGIVTMEDVVEELVGDIFSEHDRNVPEPIQREADGSAILSGLSRIRAANRALNIELPEDGPWTTVAGLALTLAGRVPAVGEVLQAPNGITLEVLDATPRRIRTIRLRPPPEPQA
jgi:putative hemolysin